MIFMTPNKRFFNSEGFKKGKPNFYKKTYFMTANIFR